jgi:hypothetical protein
MHYREYLHKATRLAKQYREWKSVNGDLTEVRGVFYAMLPRRCASPGDS